VSERARERKREREREKERGGEGGDREREIAQIRLTGESLRLSITKAMLQHEKASCARMVPR